MNRFARAFTTLTDGFHTARLNHTFNRMSDRQLADIGLSRENVSLRALELAQSR
jgi:uncharacterized protein YjiS (DUF1127 family)